MAYRDLMEQAAQLPQGDPRNYLVPVEALEGEVQRVGGTVNRGDLSEFASRLSTLSPVQRAYVERQLAQGRPAVVTVQGPPLQGGLPQQVGFYPVGVPVDSGSSVRETFAPFPNPQPPSAHSPLEDVLTRARMQASRGGTLPSTVHGGAPELTRDALNMMRRAEASRYAPNGAYAQSVQAMQMAQQRPLSPTDPRRLGQGAGVAGLSGPGRVRWER